MSARRVTAPGRKCSASESIRRASSRFLPEADRPAIVMICSPSFSGSTMLDLMLGNADDAFSCGEVGFWFRPVYRDQRHPRCACGESPCSIWRQMERVPEQRFHQMCALYQQSRFVIDSTKDLCWIHDVNRWGISSRQAVLNIVIWKTPVEYAHSLWKRSKDLRTGFERYLKYYRRLAELRLPIVAVNCERLTAEPREQLRALCKVLGMPYFPGKEQFWEKQHHSLFGSPKARRTLTQVQPQFVRRKCYSDEFWRAYADFSPRERQADVIEVRNWLERHDVASIRPFRPDRNSPELNSPWWLRRQRLAMRLRQVARWQRPARVVLED